MAEKGLTGQDMAKVIGKTPKTFYNKMKEGVFDSNEIEAIVDALDISNPIDIFFAK
jgi:DNA-binding XRE family transcriptional regulator